MKIISILLGTGSLLFSSFCLAETPAATGMAKDEWLGKLKAVAPDTICKSFTGNEAVNKQMQAANISYDKCLTIIPSSYDKCQAQYYGNIPDTVTSADAEKWGSTIGECIGSDFALNHFINNTNATPASDSTSHAPSS